MILLSIAPRYRREVEALTAELRKVLDLTKFAGPWSLPPEPAVAEPEAERVIWNSAVLITLRGRSV